MTASALAENEDAALVGIWVTDDGYELTELLFRSDGCYQLDKIGIEPAATSFSERGRYACEGRTLALAPHDWFGEPSARHYEFELAGESLTLSALAYPESLVYQLKPGSRDDVLSREQVDPLLVGVWERSIVFAGKEEYTFRPAGYYVLKFTTEGGQFPPELTRGRYQHEGSRSMLKPYGGIEAWYEVDFFGNTLTRIRNEEFFGESAAYALLSGSRAEVLAKAAEAEAFLGSEHWQVGVWEVRDAIHTVDLAFRPDGYYIAREETEYLRGIVRGRYRLHERRIDLQPFVGQGIYARSNGEFGLVARSRELDYYDGELQFIDAEAFSQSVTVARKQAGSESPIMEKLREAQAVRQSADWQVGIWEVSDPSGWMEFTFRPDHRYILKSGAFGVPGQVERGRYAVGSEKFTLAPYENLGPARGFELDLYDGELFLVGDLARMVVARKLPDSEQEVIRKTQDPDAMKGECGTILGLWSARLPGQWAELVFREDGQFRMSRCIDDVIGRDYGLYSVDMLTRTLVSDSRFIEVQSHGLDFYGNTLTIHGGLGPPRTYTVNLGVVDAAIAASFAADEAEARIDAEWLARVPIGARDKEAVHHPTGDIPPDPNPGRIFPSPTVLARFALYRRLIPGFVYFNVSGTIRSVAVVNTRAWYFFPTGRVLVRFQNHRAGWTYPSTELDTSDSWGAYRIEPKPALNDILHLYADNTLLIETDTGEQAEMTLEDGRRNLFWGKDFQILSEWAAEQRPMPCQAPADADPSLINSPVSLSTSIEPDSTEAVERGSGLPQLP